MAARLARRNRLQVVIRCGTSESGPPAHQNYSEWFRRISRSRLRWGRVEKWNNSLWYWEIVQWESRWTDESIRQIKCGWWFWLFIAGAEANWCQQPVWLSVSHTKSQRSSTYKHEYKIQVWTYISWSDTQALCARRDRRTRNQEWLGRRLKGPGCVWYAGTNAEKNALHFFIHSLSQTLPLLHRYLYSFGIYISIWN